MNVQSQCKAVKYADLLALKVFLLILTKIRQHNLTFYQQVVEDGTTLYFYLVQILHQSLHSYGS